MKNKLLGRFFSCVKSCFLSAALLLMLVGIVHAQDVSVSGKVTSNEDPEGLPGVNVIEEGTTNGVVTNIDGTYSLSVSEGATLIFSSVGYVSEEIVIGNQSVINVVLQADVTQLEELVVIGYGSVKKSDLTGSVSSVSGEDLVKMPVASISETMTGKMAGVQITSTEGSPDAEIKIRVRGGGSITQDNSPLFIVDGFPVNSISDISPTDIKTIDVLKDASSTAIYGSRGANGVVIVTTKGGQSGKLTVSLNSYYGAKKIAKKLGVLDPEDYVNWQYEYAAIENDLPSYEKYFGSRQDIDLYAGQPGNNWQEQVYGRTGNVMGNDLSVRGGTEKLTYSFNYARFSEKSIMVGSDYSRNNVTLKLNNKPTDKVELGFTVRYSDTNINGGGANEQNEASSADSRLKHSVTYSPIPLSGLTTDATDEQISSYLVNPLVATDDNDRLQIRKNFNLLGSFDWIIIKNLKFRTELGLDNYGYNDSRFYGLSTYYVSNAPAAENQDQPAVILRDRKEIKYRNANTLSYDFKGLIGNDNHNLNLLVGEEMIQAERNEITSVVHGFPELFTSQEAFKLTSQGKPQSVDNYYSPDDKLLSFFGRATYDFKSRYLLSATYRADGSSKFLGSNRWGYFPSVAAAWKINEESFMSGTSGWLNHLKIRASYGEAGNNNIPVGQTFQSFESKITSWMNGFDSYWSASKTLANPDLKWETTKTRNVGLDFGLIQGRLSGTVEAYLNTTSDLLIQFPVAGTGYDTQFRNMGETENKGIEATLNYIAIDKPNYGLNLSVNVSFNRNNVNSLGVMDDFGQSSGWASTEIGNDFLVNVGSPIGIMYGYRNDGRYEVSDFEGYNESDGWVLKSGVADGSQILGTVTPGMMKLKDLTGDGQVTIDDQEVIGNANPLHFGGFNINGYAAGFDLTASFNWSYGNDIYNANKIEYTSSTPRYQYRNLIDMVADGNRWTNVDPSTGDLVTDPNTLASLNANTTMWSPYMARYVFSDWAVEKGSFLRLNTLTLGYTLPKDIISKLHIQNLRFYATGYNLFVLTDYSGFDPEVSTRRKTPLTPGVDYSAYPRSRQIVFGLNLSF